MESITPSFSKSQATEVAFSDRLVNWTVKGALPSVLLAVKFATGRIGFSVTLIVADFEFVPFPLIAVRLTV